MMGTIESVGYLKGLFDGLDFDDDKKETKMFKAIIDVFENLVEEIGDMTEGLEVLGDHVDAIDEDLTDVEDYLFDEYDSDCDCDDCCDCDDEEYQEFEVECPLCNTEFTVDADTVLGGPVACPNCGEMLEFEIEECEEEEE